MRPKRLSEGIAIWVACLVTTTALGGTFSAELSRSEGSLSDLFVLTLSVEGRLEGEIAPPEVDGLTFQFAGTQSVSSWINGKAIAETRYQFRIVPEKPGTYKIPPIEAVVDGKKETTLPLTLVVTKSAQGGVKPYPQARSGKRPAPTQSNDPDGGIFIEKECDNLNPFQGQQVLCTVRVYHLGNLTGAQRVSRNSPDFRRFTVEGERAYVKVVNGKRYEVIEMREIAVPLTSGKKMLPPFVLKARVLHYTRHNNPLDDFFRDLGGGMFNFQFSTTQEREVDVESKEIELDVKPLPTEGKPANFSGLVGNFQLSGQVSRRNLKAGETVTITLTLSGEGVLDTLPPPETAFAKLGKVYEDKPDYKEELHRERGIVASRSFKYALVPDSAGEFDLGNVEISAFNPRLGRYVHLQAPLGKIIVEPSEVEEKPVVAAAPTSAPVETRKDVEELAQDLIAPHRDVDLASNQALTMREALLALAVGGAPLTLALGMLGFTQVRRTKDPAKTRRSKAYAFYGKASEAARKKLDGSPSEALDELGSAFRSYVGDKLGGHGKALATRDLEARIAALPNGEALAERVRAVFGQLEAVQYGGKGLSGNEASRLADELDGLAREVESRC